MVYDYYKENPYKKDEAKFNSEKYKGSSLSEKKILHRLLDNFDLI